MEKLIRLLRILDSLYKSIDTTHLTTLIGLDLSAAFDTISHSSLLERIRDEFGVSGAPLRWLQSYLTDRRHYVKLGRHCSSAVQCSAGVPQGSVLGPILFAAYISPVGQFITSHGVEHRQYADDTQLFLAMRHRLFVPVCRRSRPAPVTLNAGLPRTTFCSMPTSQRS